MDGQAVMEIERPRSAPELIGETFELYRRFPLLFLALAAVVVVPYELIVLAVTGTGPVTAGRLTFADAWALIGVSLVLVTPLVSALHIHAVDDVNEGGRPELVSVARRSLRSLPVVAATVIVAALGIGIGLVLLVVPGVVLAFRWSVAAQAAAIEDGGWTDALRRSADFARGHWEHIFGTLILAGLVGFLPGVALSVAFRHSDTSVLSFVVGTAFQVLVRSFSALVGALLFFDLRSRFRLVGGQQVIDVGSPAPGPRGSAPERPGVEPAGHPLDPRSYSDAERPHGWYVDPLEPRQMTYWSGQERLGWTPGRATTPKKTLADWQAYEAGNPEPPPTPAAVAPPTNPSGHPLDPDSYSDADRPPGWYVVPDKPWRMRFWSGGDPATGWSHRTAKTPKQTLGGWWKIRR